MPPQSEPTKQLLHDGIIAAKAGQRAKARDLFQRAVIQKPNSATAWLWLSGVTDDPLEQETCLENVLDLDPHNETARKGLRVVRQRATEMLLQRGIDAIQAGKREQARVSLLQVVERDERNISAWLWLSGVVDTLEDQEICYENILALDPNNTEATERLVDLQKQREAAYASLQADIQEASVDHHPAPTLASAVLGKAYVRKHTTVVPETQPKTSSAAAQLWEKYEDEWRCPYCAAPTGEEDRVCAACGNPLWRKVRRREEPSLSFWILVSLQALTTGLGLLIPIMALYIVSIGIGLRDFTELFNVYLGIGSDLPPDIAAAALTHLPRSLFFLSWLPAIIAAVITVALYLRWTPMFYLMLLNAVASLLVSIIGLIMFSSQGAAAALGGGVGVIIAILSFLIVLKLEDDFKKDKIRLHLRIDEGMTDGVAFLIRGKQYANQKMWARAAIHFRRAAALQSFQTDGHIATATALIKIKDYALAKHILNNAQDINPEDAQVVELLALLQAHMSDDTDI